MEWKKHEGSFETQFKRGSLTVSSPSKVSPDALFSLYVLQEEGKLDITFHRDNL
jgi:hypothetical protein